MGDWEKQPWWGSIGNDEVKGVLSHDLSSGLDRFELDNLIENAQRSHNEDQAGIDNKYKLRTRDEMMTEVMAGGTYKGALSNINAMDPGPAPSKPSFKLGEPVVDYMKAVAEYEKALKAWNRRQIEAGAARANLSVSVSKEVDERMRFSGVIPETARRQHNFWDEMIKGLQSARGYMFPDETKITEAQVIDLAKQKVETDLIAAQKNAESGLSGSYNNFVELPRSDAAERLGEVRIKLAESGLTPDEIDKYNRDRVYWETYLAGINSPSVAPAIAKLSESDEKIVKESITGPGPSWWQTMPWYGWMGIGLAGFVGLVLALRFTRR